MSDIYHLDYETYSPVDIKTLGHYRYAEDSKILMFAIAKNNEDPVIWVHQDYVEAMPADHDNEAAWDMLGTAILEEALIYAHNAGFEIAVSHYAMERDIGFPPPALDRWRCTASMALKAALPSSLAKCGEALELDQQKYSRGSVLMKMFSIPDKKTGEVKDPLEHPEEFQEYCLYCIEDVKSEQAIHRALDSFELKGSDLESFLLYMKVNHRGLPVDTKTLKLAGAIIQESEQMMATEFKDLTGLTHNQRDKLLFWLAERGYPFENMQAATVRKALESIDEWCEDPEAYHALHLKQQLSFAAFKKIKTMQDCACSDGRVRGSLQWYGAHTGRGSGRLIQPQNFKRPTIKNTEEIYARMRNNDIDRETMEAEYGNPLEVVSSCIRHFIHSEEDQTFLDADYSSIEARVVCWLAGQRDALVEYENNDDAYIKMAVKIFNCSEEDQLARKDAGESTVERFVGKQAVLGCSYQMGVPRFLDTCNTYGFSIPEAQVRAYMQATGLSYEGSEKDIKLDLAATAVRGYREKYNKVVDLWDKAEKAAKAAIKTPGQVFSAGPKIRFQVTRAAGMDYLLLALPSGRCIVYPRPILAPRDNGKGDQVKYWAKLPGKMVYGYVSTYGGKLVENATQGCAADVMASGSAVAEERGYKIATLIHDEALVFKTDPLQNIEELCEALTTLPSWADGLPVAAEGFETPYYKK